MPFILSPSPSPPDTHCLIYQTCILENLCHSVCVCVCVHANYPLIATVLSLTLLIAESLLLPLLLVSVWRVHRVCLNIPLFILVDINWPNRACQQWQTCTRHRNLLWSVHGSTEWQCAAQAAVFECQGCKGCIITSRFALFTTLSPLHLSLFLSDGILFTRK